MSQNDENEQTIYQQKGYEDRKDYLKSLSEDYGVPYYMVLEIANMLGETEDFDGLVTSLEDAEGMF